MGPCRTARWKVPAVTIEKPINDYSLEELREWAKRARDLLNDLHDYAPEGEGDRCLKCEVAFLMMELDVDE